MITLLLDAVTTGDGSGVSVTQVIIALVAVCTALSTVAGLVYRGKNEQIEDRDKEIARLRLREDEDRRQSERAYQTLEQAVAIAANQNDTINRVVEKQGAALETITDRLEEIKSTATRRSRTP